MTFDSLRPLEKQYGSLIVKMTASGQPRPWAFGAGHQTGAFVGKDALRLGDPADALARSKMISPERKEYVAARWEYWRQVESDRDWSRHTYADSMGTE